MEAPPLSPLHLHPSTYELNLLSVGVGTAVAERLARILSMSTLSGGKTGPVESVATNGR